MMFEKVGCVAAPTRSMVLQASWPRPHDLPCLLIGSPNFRQDEFSGDSQSISSQEGADVQGDCARSNCPIVRDVGLTIVLEVT